MAKPPHTGSEMGVLYLICWLRHYPQDRGTRPAVRVLCRGHALVHLRDMHAVPRQILFCQDTKHVPRRVATAHGQDEAAPCSDRSSGLRCNDRGRLLRDGIDIGEYFNLHDISWRLAW